MLSFAPGMEEDELLECALEAGAEDVRSNEDGSFDVITAPENFGAVMDALAAAELEPANAEVAMIPDTYSELDEETSLTVMKIIDQLEDLDDVQNVYTNASFDDAAYG